MLSETAGEELLTFVQCYDIVLFEVILECQVEKFSLKNNSTTCALCEFEQGKIPNNLLSPRSLV